MKVLAADAYLAEVWPAVWPLLEPAIKRAPDKPDVLAKLRSHDAQLWTVCEGGQPIAATVTAVQDRVVIFWLIGGSRAREWGQRMVDEVEAWARALDCVAMRGMGRLGWARVVNKLGFERIPDIEGQPAWQRSLTDG